MNRFDETNIDQLEFIHHNLFMKNAITNGGQIYKSICSEIEPKDLGYSETMGHPKSRKTLVDYLQQMRRVKCHENQIIITNGAVQALWIIGQVLLKEGELRAYRFL